MQRVLDRVPRVPLLTSLRETEWSRIQWTVPAVLLVVCGISYGLLAPWLGFYSDDWLVIWILHSLGPSGSGGEGSGIHWRFLSEGLTESRPFLGLLYSVTWRLVGEAPLGWHILALVARWLGSIAAWWTICGVWPERRSEAAWAGLLFAVYPGFTQQPIAFTHAHGSLIPLALFVFSLGAMVWAVRVRRFFWPLTVLALFSTAASNLIVERFVGLELLRPVLLWLAFEAQAKAVRERIRFTMFYWLPYAVVVFGAVAWRLFLFKPARAAADQSLLVAAALAHPVHEATVRLGAVASDVIETGLIAWAETFRPEIFDFGSGSALAAFAISVIGMLAVILYLGGVTRTRDGNPTEADDAHKRWSKQAIVVGLFALVVSGLPIWFARRQVILNDPFDRYAVSFMLGACVFAVGLISIAVRTRRQRIAIVGLIVGLALGFHFRNANRFRQDWNRQKALFWQLTWRAPGLEQGTSVLIDQAPFIQARDYSLSASLNFVYARDRHSANLDYYFFDLSKNLGDEVPRLAEGVDLQRDVRAVSFRGSSSSSISIWYSPPGCLRILDPSGSELRQLTPLARAASAISHPGRVVVQIGGQAEPPSWLFGPEPAPCWCYYFEKADLARQQHEWQRAAQLGDEARHLGLKPADPTEWLPFAEAYTNLSRYEDVREIARLARDASGGITSPMCGLWSRLEGEHPVDPTRRAFIGEMKDQCACAAGDKLGAVAVNRYGENVQ